jgi:4-amino-4-deoxy-L-arabinose transferase-like glycosyltransferase
MYFIIKKWTKENKKGIFLVCAIIVFFFVYSHFYFSTASLSSSSFPKFNSPDETSNYFFTKLYAENGVVRIFEPLNLIVGNRIYPRSVVAANGYLAPGGFLGIILIYGWLAKIFGTKIILYLTPIFAGLAVFYFYEIIKKIFDKKIAFWSALLLLVHPAFWYFSSRGLFPNILFASLLIIGFYFLLKPEIERNKKWNYVEFILAGLFFGLALTVRFSEAIWVGGALLILFLIYRKNLKWRQIVLFLFFTFLTFLPILIYNQIFYGSPFITAYNLSDGGVTIAGGGAGSSWLIPFKQYILPFGFNLKNIFKNFSNYFAGMFWWLAIPAAFGVSVFIKRFINGKLNKKVQVYLFLYFFISLFLFIYYGSWLFSDKPNVQPSIGISYVRYWLPIYILSLPFIIFALIKFVNWFHGWQKKIIVGSLCIIYFFLSFSLVFFDKNEGLVKVKANVEEYTRIAQEVGQTVESDAVIIVDQADKIFFPEYKVIQPLRDERTYKLIPDLAEIVPLYYYGVTLPQKDIDYLYAKKLDPQKVEIIKIKDFGIESLYKLEPRSRSQELGIMERY